MIEDLRQNLENFRLWFLPYSLIIGVLALLILLVLWVIERRQG